MLRPRENLRDQLVSLPSYLLHSRDLLEED